MQMLGLTFGLALVMVMTLKQSAVAAFVLIPSPGGSPDSTGLGGFLLTSDVLPSYRFQQVNRGLAFSAVSTTSPVLITELSYAASTLSRHIDVNLPNIEIRLSTTARNPDGLSATFANNIGADETVVYSGALHFFDTGLETYGIHIPLQHPFTYDYSQGNLIVDVFNFSTIPPPVSGSYELSGKVTVADAISHLEGNVNAPTGIGSTAGLSTRFTATPVPEPGTNLLFLSGVAACAVLGWKRRAFHW